jgi:hypothetical protein
MREFLLGDHVRYCGNKFYNELNSKVGIVVGYIQNNSKGYVVEFGDDSYVVSNQVVKKAYVDNSKSSSFMPRKRYDED